MVCRYFFVFVDVKRSMHAAVFALLLIVMLGVLGGLDCKFAHAMLIPVYHSIGGVCVCVWCVVCVCVCVRMRVCVCVCVCVCVHAFHTIDTLDSHAFIALQIQAQSMHPQQSQRSSAKPKHRPSTRLTTSLHHPHHPHYPHHPHPHHPHHPHPHRLNQPHAFTSMCLWIALR